MEVPGFRQRCASAVRKVLPSTLKTALWMIKITVGVSFAIMLLGYFGFIDWLSAVLSPLFVHFGLPGEAALAYVSGYFVNMYSAVTAAVALDLDARAVTILGVMVLCSHNMIVETAVQKKTGSPALLMVLVRTLSGIILAYMDAVSGRPEFRDAVLDWLMNVCVLVPKMLVIIFALNILQALLAEFGIIRLISRMLRPVMRVFGLSARCSVLWIIANTLGLAYGAAAVLWIIANTLGLAYGAAAMIEEAGNDKLRKADINGLNLHIGISHSNLEDLFLLASIGAAWWVLLLARWAMAIILVWGYRLEAYIKNKYVSL